MSIRSLFYLGAVYFSLAFSPLAPAASIDLNDFFADPTVTLAANGSSATIAEDSDPAIGVVVLANDPGLGDQEVVTAAPNTLLLFSYEFTEGDGENDEFGAFVIDSGTGLSIGPAFEFFTQNTSSSIVSFALSDLIGNTLGLQFQLSRLPGDTGANTMVTISDVRTTVIPTPSALLLLFSGIAVLLRCQRRREGRSKQR